MNNSGKKNIETEAIQALKIPLVLRGISCVILPVSDRLRSLEFYRDKLGMMARALSDGTWEVSTGQIALRFKECILKEDRITITFWLPIWELLQAGKRLKALGIKVNGPFERLGVEQVLVLKDPDKHNIELIARGSSSDLKKSRFELSEKRGRGPGGRSWDNFYSSVPVEDMPWYTDCLDKELITALLEYAPLPGRLLEIGSGSGSAAARLAALGYDVVAIDIAAAAVEHAHSRFGIFNHHLIYKVADACQPIDYLGSFNYVFDRGCFHSISLEMRQKYVCNVAEAIRPGGRFFLKVFSSEKPGDRGPHRFDNTEILEIFKMYFSERYVTKSTFESNSAYSPKGLFFILERI